MRHNNKGLSLVELIVVIAIMSVLTGVVSFGISNIFNTKVTQCADNMENIINSIISLNNQIIIVLIFNDFEQDFII